MSPNGTKLPKGSQYHKIPIKTHTMKKKDEMVKIWFDDMEEMFQIKLSEWEKIEHFALPPYNNYSKHLKVDDDEWVWSNDASELEYMYHRIKVWRESYGNNLTKFYRNI